MQVYKYNRTNAVQYAHKWAFGRNTAYMDFEKMGGDCTNFISQCIMAGTGVMNYTPIYGWYFINSYKRSASWTGVEFLYKFLVNNKGIGPYAKTVSVRELEVGDIIQLSFYNNIRFGHSLIVVKIDYDRNNRTLSDSEIYNHIYINTHTYDRDTYLLSNYIFDDIRFLHIEGYRK